MKIKNVFSHGSQAYGWPARRNEGAQKVKAAGESGRVSVRRGLAPELRRYITRSRRFGLFISGKDGI